ncbi:hypothetical protein MSTE_04858 [Mycobacteroides stephanolepidis]|uniref:Uncharacterized protein n=1 Tax=[Mycobacterium] stephanolepidis TaxID=1520670 RepID=A0A1Z4F4M9_9MYCO|nr:hypothetical protein MSTE_04858 [[Mycobacterium] stephanolepidis]
MAHPGDRTEPNHHLLIHVEHGNQQGQRPYQRHAVVLSGLGVRGDASRVVVADHHDEAGTQDRQQHPESLPLSTALGALMLPDGAQGADDVADMRAVHDSAGRGVSVVVSAGDAVEE